ncbi:hypothetical protein AAHA92_30635 [Salvia divinorum]|uniref:Tunicamycin induced 1 n=1 Tax=Salvia divinorum TaxID=28513 RepID=A0ABD1FRJ3_SALDI
MFNFACLIQLNLLFSKSSALVAAPDFNPPYPKAISDLKEAIVKGLGLQADDFKVSGFDLRDALVGRSVAYELDVEIENKVLPLKLLEDLAGSLELWIQNAKVMRISLPHDVDAGVLKKVILADGTVVTVKDARSVSLHHPVELPLPLNITDNGFASGLISLPERLQDVARSQMVLNRLKLKRLAPGLVELSSASKKRDAISPVDLQGGEATTLLAPDHFSTLWPVVSINGSNPNLLGFEALLSSMLGPGGSFVVEKRLKEGDVVGIPAWRKKPSTVRIHFEVLAKVDGNRIVPLRVEQVNPVIAEDSVALLGNVTMPMMPVVHQPPNPFMLRAIVEDEEIVDSCLFLFISFGNIVSIFHGFPLASCSCSFILLY